MRLPATALLALHLLPGCIETDITPKGPHADLAEGPILLLDPPVLDFGAEGLGVPTVRALTVGNGGGARLTIDGMVVTGSGAFWLPAAAGFVLEPGEQRDLELTYTPLGEQDEGQLVVASDDPQRPQGAVELLGQGLLPALEVDPGWLDFDRVVPGCLRERELLLRSVGDADLTVSSMALQGEGFTLTSPPSLPLSIPAGQELALQVQFGPWVPSQYQSALLVEHNGSSGGDQVPLQGQGASEVRDEFMQGSWPRMDLVLTVDRSGSMNDDASNLVRNFSTFADAMEDNRSDWQVAVVTRDTGCRNGGLLTADTPNLDEELRSAVFTRGGGLTEAGLSLALEALEQAYGGCNEGLLREGALRAVLMVSDEPEQSREGWQELVLDMQGLVPDVQLFAVAGDVPDGCSSAQAGTGYYEAVMATDGRFFSICDSDWGDTLHELAGATQREITDTFPLSAEPDPSTLEVFVDGQRSVGWRHDGGSNSVVFFSGFVPDEGAQVLATYFDLNTCH